MSRSLQTLMARAGLALLGGLLTLGIGLNWVISDASRTVEFLARDLTTPLFSRPAAADGIALIDIDESSIRQVESWPWRRSTIAALIGTALETYQAKIVVLDVVLPDPRDASGDAQILSLAKERRLVLAQVFDFVDRDIPILNGSPAGTPVASPASNPAIAPAIAAAASSKTETAGLAVQATGIVANHSGLSGAPCVGNIGFIPDADGKLRRIVQHTEWQGKIYPSLSLATLQCLKTSGPEKTTSQALMPLRFDIEPSSFTVIPAREILAQPNTVNPVLADQLRGKIVVIGSSALGLSDRVSTPRSSSISGMFVHAQAFSELTQPRAPALSSWSFPVTLGVQIALVLLFAAGIMASRSLLALLGVSAITLAAWSVFLVLQVDAGNQHLLTSALWGAGFIALTLIPLEWSQARAQSRARAKILARYVSKPVLKDLLKEQNFDPLKPRSAEITVLVADMVSYSEKVAGQNLDNAARITREFLDALTQPVWSTRGTLDRYTGDGLVAFWGAPIATSDHPQMALKAALGMQEQVAILNAKLKDQGLPMLAVRIGIASGPALVGDFGTKLRASYTAVGTCINMASRLESAAKELGVSILVSQETASSLDYQGLEALGPKEIRGIGNVTVYTVKH